MSAAIDNLMTNLSSRCGGSSSRDMYEEELPHEKQARLIAQMDKQQDFEGVHVIPSPCPPPPLEDGDTLEKVDYSRVKAAKPDLYEDGVKITEKQVELLSKEDAPEYLRSDVSSEDAPLPKKPKKLSRKERLHNARKEADSSPPEEPVSQVKSAEERPQPRQCDKVEPTIKEHPLITYMKPEVRDSLQGLKPSQLERISTAIEWFVELAKDRTNQEASMQFPGMGTFKFPLVDYKLTDTNITLCLRSEDMQFVPEVGVVLGLAITTDDFVDQSVVYSGGNIRLESLGVVFMSFLLHNAVED